MSKPKTMSGAEFRMHFTPLLQSLSDEDEVFFGGGDISFYRIKERGPVSGPRLVQVEFNEVISVVAAPTEEPSNRSR